MSLCKPCEQKTATVPLFPNCEPIEPCTEGCEVTINAKCVIYTGDTLTKLGLTNPTDVETVLEKIHILLNSQSSGLLRKVRYEVDSFSVSDSDDLIILNAPGPIQIVNKIVTLIDPATLDEGKQFEFKINTTTGFWFFNMNVYMNHSDTNGLTSINQQIIPIFTHNSFKLVVVKHNNIKKYMIL